MSFLRTVFTPPFFKRKIDFFSSLLKKYTFIEIEKVQSKSRTLVYSYNQFDLFINIYYRNEKPNSITSVIKYNDILFHKKTLQISQEMTIKHIVSVIDYFDDLIQIDNKKIELVLNYFNKHVNSHNYKDYIDKEYVDLKFDKDVIFIFTFLSRTEHGNNHIVNKSFFVYENICWCHEELLSMEKLSNNNYERIKKENFEFIFSNALSIIPNDILVASVLVSTYKNTTHSYHEISVSNNHIVFRFVFLIDKENYFTFKIYKANSNIEKNFNSFIHSPNKQDLYFSSINRIKLINNSYSVYMLFDKFEVNDFIGPIFSDILISYFACPQLLEEFNFQIPLHDEQIEVLKLAQY